MGVAKPLLVLALAIAPIVVSASLASAGDTVDTVLLNNGGRVRGTVFVAEPGKEVRIRLADGSIKKIPAADVKAISYGGEAPVPLGPAPSASPPPAPPPPPPPPASSAPPPKPAPPAPASASVAAPKPPPSASASASAPAPAPTPEPAPAPAPVAAPAPAPSASDSAAPVATEEPEPPQPQTTALAIGVRGAVGHSFGLNSGSSGVDYSGNDYLDFPLWLDLGVRLGKLYLGVHAAYGIVPSPSPNCPLSSSCSLAVYDLRGGADVFYHPRGGAKLDPWVGGSVGYEGLSETSKTSSLTSTLANTTNDYRNFFEASAQAGLDFHLVPAFSMGPFLAATLDVGDATATWLMIGLRVTTWIPLSQASDGEAAPQEAAPPQGSP